MRRPMGARLDKIMEITRHTSPRMVLRYIREAEAFEDHAGAAFLGPGGGPRPPRPPGGPTALPDTAS